jgi:hypothetical protein
MCWLDRNNISQRDFSLLIEDIPLFVYKEGTKIDHKTIDKIEYNHEKILKD